MPLTFPTTSQKKPSAFTALPNQIKRPAFGSLYGFDAQGGGASLDEDAQKYFDTLEGLGDWVAPADYTDKQAAISTYVAACKTAGNWEKIHALYLPIWQLASANALSAKRSEDGVDLDVADIYNLTFVGTVTHDAGDYIHGDGSSGYAVSGFRGPAGTPTFFGYTDTSISGNVLGGTLTTADALWGWWYEFSFYPYFTATHMNMYGWKYGAASQLNIAHGGSSGFWSVNSSTPVSASRLDLYKNGSLHGYKDNITSYTYQHGSDFNWLRASYGYGADHYSQYQVNFLHAGQQMADIGAFNTDTSTLLAAL